MPETNKEIVERVNASFADNMPEVFLSYCANDVVWRMVGEKEYQGVIAIRDFMKSMEGMEPQKISVDETVDSGDAVVSYGDMTMKGEDGKEAAYSFCDIYHFRNGKITELRSFVVTRKAEGKISESAKA